MKILTSIIGLLLLSLVGLGQMTTSNNLTVQQYVQQVLLGANVSVSNITYNGGSANQITAAVGGFEAQNSNLGIASGFAMSTGDVAGMAGPNSTGSYTGTGTGGFNGTDPDLLSLVQANGGNTINDWVIIEFDFVPLGDTLRFNYVWGSEEYDTYVGSGFNDVFGFFISGPGINGPYANNAANIALVPGTNVNVAINSINNGQGNAGPCTNCQYYNQYGNDNDFWNNQNDPMYTDPYYMQYDGYTDVLTAMAVVQCGQTYHIKLAVCDANDGALDSGVFLQRESFSSNLVVQVSLNLTVSGPDGNSLYEDCGEGTIVFQRPQSGNPDTELIAEIAYSGTATMGVDYNMLPTQVIFAPGVMTVEIPLDAFSDGITEGPETVNMNITNIAECGDTYLTSSFSFVIRDIADPLVVTGFDIEICSNSTTTLQPTVQGGYAVYRYLWSTAETTPSITVGPPNTTTYFVTVSDTCGVPSQSTQFQVTVLQVPQLLVDLVDQDGVLPLDCDSWGDNIYTQATGGVSPYSYVYFDDNGTTLFGSGSTLGVSSWDAGWVYVTVTDQCGYNETDSLLITVNAPPLALTMPASVTSACAQPFQILAQASGGYLGNWATDYSYSWSFNGVPDWFQWGNPYNGVANAPGMVQVVVQDNCGQSITGNTQVIIDSPPILIDLLDETTGTCATLFNFVPIISGGSGGFVYQWLNGSTLLGTGANQNFMSNQSTIVTLNVTDACGAQATDAVLVNIVNPPVSIDLGSDIEASCIDNTLLTPQVSGGSGGFQYQWFVNGQPQSTLPTHTVQFYTTSEVQVVVNDACGATASDAVIIHIPDVPLTIAAAADTSICVGGTAYLWASAQGGEGGFAYTWSNQVNGAEQYIVSPTSSGSYTVTATDICNKQIQATTTVSVLPIHAGFNVTNLNNNTFQFTQATEPACANCLYTWNFGDGATSSSPIVVHEFDGLGSYTVTHTATNEIGCSSITYYTIVGPALVYIPNSFSPNGDGINDVFRVYGSSIREYELQIFNRWGDLVFHSTDPEDVWIGDTYDNGSHFVQNSIYSYVVRVKGFDSDSFKQKGTITVLR